MIVIKQGDEIKLVEQTNKQELGDGVVVIGTSGEVLANPLELDLVQMRRGADRMITVESGRNKYSTSESIPDDNVVVEGGAEGGRRRRKHKVSQQRELDCCARSSLYCCRGFSRCAVF